MSAATFDPTLALDTTGTPAIPPGPARSASSCASSRDTRAGKWLLIAIAAITLAIIVIFFFAADQSERTFSNFMAITATPQGFLLPVLGILLVTSEWTQRTALVTFTLVPVRGRVLFAKVVAALIAGFAAIVVALAIAALATAVGGADNAWANIGVDDIGKFGLLQVSGVLQGLAFGLLFLNSAAAIVTYFVLPTAFSIVASLWSAAERDRRRGSTWAPRSSRSSAGTHLTGEDWAQLGTATADLGGAALRARPGPGAPRRGEVARPCEGRLPGDAGKRPLPMD